MREHSVILVPGLGDKDKLMAFSVRNWEKKYRISPIVHIMPWKENGESFDVKLNRLLNLVDEIKNDSKLVSLIGVSAGGSAVVNAFIERTESVHRVINACGRLAEGSDVHPTLDRAGKGKPTFIESVKKVQSGIPKMSIQDRQKILTIRPRFGDETVPSETVVIPGATNVTTPTIEHVLSIAYSFQFPAQMIQFLTNPTI